MTMHKDRLTKIWESTVKKTHHQPTKKRNGGIFSAMSVAHVDDDDNTATSSGSGTRVFDNGDNYTGDWIDNRPHGRGTYSWTDGSSYSGDWFKGKATGKGRFCSPSGAVYDGDFKSGFMDGSGTYTSPSGYTYSGSWVMNYKHGKGNNWYSNGDYYEGEWSHDLQNGHGTYVWKNKNSYVGEWKNGDMNGKGTMSWINGNWYDGCWEDGFPKGEGRFGWADGGVYVGTWSKDPTERNGTYYPSSGSIGGIEPQDICMKDMRECNVSCGEKTSVLLSQKSLNLVVGQTESGTKHAVRRSSKVADSNGRPPPLRRSNGGWESNGEGTLDFCDGNVCGMRNSKEGSDSLRVEDKDTARRWGMKELKRQGQTISKGHKNYELMLNLQLGIRYSVGKHAPATSLDLKSSAFDPREKVWTKFPPEGSKYTPPHQSSEFKWKDYCPQVFRTLRKLFKIDAADYMLSICGNDALRELSSPGKSGSFFYLTHDDRYMIKTMKKSEVKVLLRMLPAYYKHVRAFENTLVTKFFGLHCVKVTGTAQKKVRFVIMGNLFCSEYPIHRRFDLKGSSHGRITDKPEEEIDATTTLKDLDLNFIFRLQGTWFHEFQKQVDRDCEFLEQERIMDYSLLVGLHFREPSFYEDSYVTGSEESDPGYDPPGRLSRGDMDRFLSDAKRWTTIRLGINMPARVEQTMRRSNYDAQLIGDPTGEFREVILFFGIIDILQDYDISKKLEHAYKSFQYDSTSISAVDPRQYCKRFRDFISKVFTEDI